MKKNFRASNYLKVQNIFSFFTEVVQIMVFTLLLEFYFCFFYLKGGPELDGIYVKSLLPGGAAESSGKIRNGTYNILWIVLSRQPNSSLKETSVCAFAWQAAKRHMNIYLPFVVLL